MLNFMYMSSSIDFSGTTVCTIKVKHMLKGIVEMGIELFSPWQTKLLKNNWLKSYLIPKKQEKVAIVSTGKSDQ